MKQTIFEIRQRAKEILEQSVAIWKQSDYSEQLEGLEKDPVMSLLMMALAYQSNEIDNEITHLKEEIINDFAQMLLPYQVSHATPATVVIQTALCNDAAQQPLDENSTFTLTNSSCSFMPLLQTKVFNASVTSVVRLDGRRWKVSLSFKHPISDISGLSFVVKHHGFNDLKIAVNTHNLPLAKPWDYSNLPFTHSFSTESMLFNNLHSFDVSSACFDLFARQDVRLFCIKNHKAEKVIPVETASP